MNELLRWLQQDPTTRVPLAVAAIALAGVVLGGFLTTILWPSLKSLTVYLWNVATGRLSKKRYAERYLDRVIQEHRYLPLLPTTLVPVTQVRVTELDRLYVSLALTENTQTLTNVDLGSALAGHPYLVLLGDPGAGKTTMLRYLALTFARARRNAPVASHEPEKGQEKRAILAARSRVKNEFRIDGYPLPLFAYLNRFRDIASWSPGRSIVEVLHEELQSSENLRGMPLQFFQDHFRRGECVFIFDAFDELGIQSARNAIAQRIGELAASAPAGNRFIVSSRVVGYDGQLAQFGFHPVTVQELSWQLIRQLVTRWYEVLGDPLLAEQLLNTLQSNARIAELAVNPMLLSLLALVQYVRRIIPDRRHVLYDECIKILVERRYAPVEVQQEYNQILPGEEAVRILRELALAFHRSHVREVPRHELEGELIPRILLDMPTSIAGSVAPRTILKNIEQRSQLLVERGFNEKSEPVMSFSHLTFQEYLTAVALKESQAIRGETNVSAEIVQTYTEDPQWWEEVALLYAAQLDDRQRGTFLQRLQPGPALAESATATT